MSCNLSGGSLTAIAVALATLGPVTPAAAQGGTAGGPSASDASGSGAPDIVVTAQRREERLQDVPVAITALSDAALQLRGAIDFDSYIRQTPGAFFNNGASQGSELKLRGVGNGTAQLSPTTAVYLGDVPVIHTGRAVNASYNFSLVDMARVEVLRGPQGQLFGSNSLGGAVRNIPNDVQLGRFGVNASASGSTTASARGNYAFDATVNVPLGDTAGVRLTGYTSRQSGWYTNNYRGGPRLGSIARTFPQPPPVRARIPGGILSTIVAENPAIGNYSAPAVNETNDATVKGARAMLRWQPDDRLNVNLMLAYEEKRFDGPGWALQIGNTPGAVPGTVAAAPFPVPYTSNARNFEYSNSAVVAQTDKIWLANLLVDYDFGGVKLTSSTAYWNRKEGLTTNIGPISGLITGVADTVPLRAVRLDNPESFSQELRLASTGAGPVKWLAGVFLQRIDQSFSQALEDASGLDIYFNYISVQNRFLGLPAPTTRIATLQQSRFLDEQQAVFGQLSYTFDEKVTADVSFRAFNLRQRANANQQGFAFVGPGQFQQNNTTQVFTPKFNLSWKPDRDRLFYASVSQGYRTGIINFPVPTPACSTALTSLGAAPGAQNVPPTKPDTVWNYEIGAKASFLDRRVQINAAAYRIDWRNLQTQVILASLTPGGVAGGCTSLQVANVGNARIQGFELEMNAAVSSAVRVEAALSYTDARYNSSFPTLNIAPGVRIEGTPDLQGYVALQYGFDIGERRGFLRGEWSYTGKIANIPLDFVTTRPPYPTGDYSEVNLRAGFDLTPELQATAFVTNVFNEYGVTRQLNQRDGAVPTLFTIRPRTIGGTLRLRY